MENLPDIEKRTQSSTLIESKEDNIVEKKETPIIHSRTERFILKFFGSEKNLKAMIGAAFIFSFSDYFLGHLAAYFLMGGIDQRFGGWGYLPIIMFTGALTSLTMAKYVTQIFGTRLVVTVSLIAFMILLSIITALPVVWSSQNLLGIDIFYYYLPNQSGFITLMFFAGMAYGLFYPAINQSAIVAEQYAKRPWLGFYYGLNAFASGIGLLTGQLSASLGALQYGDIPAYKLFWASAVIMSCLSIGFYFWLHDKESEAKIFALLEADKVIHKMKIHQLSHQSTHELEMKKIENESTKNPMERKESLHVASPSLSLFDKIMYPKWKDKANDKENKDDEHHDKNQSLIENSFIRETLVEDFVNNSLMSPQSIQDVYDNVSKDVASLWTIMKRKDILILGSMIFMSTFTDQSFRTWCSMYFTQQLGSGNILQSVGYDTYHICYGIGALSVDRWRRFYTDRLIIGACGSLMVIGMFLFLLAGSGSLGEVRAASGQIFVAVAGSALVGLGVVPILSIAMSRACLLHGVPYSAGTSIMAIFDFAGRIFGILLVAALYALSGSLLHALIIEIFLFAIVPCVALTQKIIL